MHRHRSTSWALYSDRSRLPQGTSSTCVCTTSTARILSRIVSARSAFELDPLGELDRHRERRLLLDALP